MRTALEQRAWDRDMAACRIVGTISALIRMGSLDPLREAYPHTYNDLCEHLLEHDVAAEDISEMFSSPTRDVVPDLMFNLKEQRGEA